MKPKRVLVITGGGYHDFETCGAKLFDFLTNSGHFKVTLSGDLRAIRTDYLNRFDALVLYTQGDGLTQRQAKDLKNWVEKGKALVGIHCASDSFRNQPVYIELLGSEFKGHGPVHTFTVEPTETDHLITRRMRPFSIEDELYLLEGDPSRWTVLMTANWRGKKEPMVYVREEGKGKVGYIALGHDLAAFTSPEFQKLVIRTLRWSTGFREAPPVRCGVIGYGGAFNMGKAHAEMISETPGLELVAVCDLDRSRTQAARDDFPQIRTFNRVASLLNEEGLDLVTLVTPHNTHGPLAVKAAEAGKHVITEKPMCITVKEADAMIAAARKSGTLLSVFHNRRWDGDYQALRRIIGSGRIGEVFQIEVFSGGYGHPGWWWRSDKRISGGCLYDWGAHFVDWILNLVPSPVETVSGYFQKKEWHGVTNEDHTVAVIRFRNGVMAQVEQSSLAAAPKDRWRVLGTKGAVRRADQDDHWTVVDYGDGDCVTSQVPFAEGDGYAYYRNIADHLTLGEDLVVKAEEGRNVIAVIETAEKASKQGKALPLP